MAHCIHYGGCGGCVSDDPDAPDKRALLREALARAGYGDAAVAPLARVPWHSRRRVDLAARRHGAEISLGLHRARSPEVADMRECALLRPELLGLLPPLRALLRGLQAFRRAAELAANWLDNGADILLRLDAPLTPPDRARLVEFAKAHAIPRLSVSLAEGEAEPIAILATPVLRFAGVAVSPPPGAFLQACPEGETAITAAILAGLPEMRPRSRIVELYSGCGTFTFPLAQIARVEAYEAGAAAAAAAERAARGAGLAGRVSVKRRDLRRQPLLPRELRGAAAVVLDPPFAGSGPQIHHLAAAQIPSIVYVSCNPAALAREAAVLRQAGYTLTSATPIDQFLYSENVESVLNFTKS